MQKLSALDTAEITIRRARFSKYVKSVMVGCGVICIAAVARAAVPGSRSEPTNPAAAAVAVAAPIDTDADPGNPLPHARSLSDEDAPGARTLATQAMRDAAPVRTKKRGRH